MTNPLWVSHVHCGFRVFKVSTTEERPERSPDPGSMTTTVYEVEGGGGMGAMDSFTMMAEVPGGPKVHVRMCEHLMLFGTLPEEFEPKSPT